MIGAGAAEIAVATMAGDVLDAARPEMTDEGLAQHREDLETAEAVFQGFNDEVLPTVADAFGVPEPLIAAGLQLRYPDVGRLIDQREEMAQFAEASLTNLERQQDNFESADDMPAPWLPAWAGGAGLVVAGLAVGSLALWSLRGGQWVMTVAGSAVVAILLIVVPLALQVPWKAADAQEVLDSLNPSEEATARTVEYMDIATAGMAELEEELLPDAAAALGLSAEELDEQLEDEFPELSVALDEMPAVLDRYEARTAIRVEAAPDLRTLKDIPIAVVSWTAPVLGVLLAVVALAAWFVGRDTRRAEGPEPLESGPA